MNTQTDDDNKPSFFEDSNIPDIILLPPTILFFASIYYFLSEIYYWIKTAVWETITVHKSLTDLHIIAHHYYFEFPNALGIEKIFNSLLFSSAPLVYFFTSVIILFIFILP